MEQESKNIHRERYLNKYALKNKHISEIGGDRSISGISVSVHETITEFCKYNINIIIIPFRSWKYTIDIRMNNNKWNL